MKHADFVIGTLFHTCTGQHWRCTDVGTRTILAIELKPDLDDSWFNGPPYAVAEIPFDEHDIARAYRSEDEAIREAIEEDDNSDHPGFPSDVMTTMMHARFSADTRAYPRMRLLRSDRLDTSGNQLHPYAVTRDGDRWIILTYLPYSGEFQQIAESDFILLPYAAK